MRKLLLHPLWCLSGCFILLYVLRREFGIPETRLWLTLFLAAYAYGCSLTLIPYILFSDWGRAARKDPMDPGVWADPVFLNCMSFHPRVFAVIGLAALLAFPDVATRVCAIAAFVIAVMTFASAWTLASAKRPVP